MTSYPSGTSGVIPTSVRKTLTTGDVALGISAAWADVAGMNATIAAAIGDILLVNLNTLWVAGAALVFADLKFASGAVLSGEVESATSQGMESWRIEPAATGHPGPSFRYVVVAGDIAGGNVTAQLRYRSGTASTLFATSADVPAQLELINLKH